MKIFASLILLPLLIRCTNQTVSPISVSEMNHSYEDKEDGLILQASDQGREGGHYLLCQNSISIPQANCRNGQDCQSPEKLFFIDYFIMIDTEDSLDSLLPFKSDEDQIHRIQKVVQRITEVFTGNILMERKIQRAQQFANSFMEKKGHAMWIEDSRPPIEIELTSDLSPKNLSTEKRVFVEEFCNGRFYQAAVYDYSHFYHEVFEYSRFFEDHADLMQLSFRNIHEMLRYILKNREATQIQKLTAYFHSKAFFNDPLEDVRTMIASISREWSSRKPFFPTEELDEVE